jgi:hypothetical protein
MARPFQLMRRMQLSLSRDKIDRCPRRVGALKYVKADNGRSVYRPTDSGGVLLGSFEGNLRIGCWKNIGLPVKLRVSEGWESGLIRRS